MKIIMQNELEVTQEIKDLAIGYDAYYMYIDNYGQMAEAQNKNEIIMAKLRPLGVERIRQ
jgi:hypothetical protein